MQRFAARWFIGSILHAASVSPDAHPRSTKIHRAFLSCAPSRVRVGGMTSESLGSTIIPRGARNTNLKNGENYGKLSSELQIVRKVRGVSDEQVRREPSQAAALGIVGH